MSEQASPWISFVGWLGDRMHEGCHWVNGGHSETPSSLSLLGVHANLFQLGVIKEDGEQVKGLLAYNPELWWFEHVWDSIYVSSTEVYLLAATETPLVVSIPSDVPHSLSTLDKHHDDLHSEWMCAPYSEPYMRYFKDVTDKFSRCTITPDDVALEQKFFLPHIRLDEQWLPK